MQKLNTMFMFAVRASSHVPRILLLIVIALAVVNTIEVFCGGTRTSYVTAFFVFLCFLHAGSVVNRACVQMIHEQFEHMSFHKFIIDSLQSICIRTLNDAVNLDKVKGHYKGTPIDSILVSFHPPAGVRIQVGDGNVWVDVLYNDLRRDWRATLDKARAEYEALAKGRRQQA